MKTITRKAPTLLLSAAFIVAGVAVWQNLITSPDTSYAASPPESCFAFSAGVITNYYDNEDNNAANPACPRAVDIPSTIGGVAVASIGERAFYSIQLTAVDIPNSVTSIGSEAFSWNQLTSIAVPSGVASIDSNAFSNNQLASVTIPSGVTSIGNSAFTRNQLTSIAIPNSVTSIGHSAFSQNQLTAVTIPNSVTSIGSSAFYNNQLTSITIPNGVTSMGSYAFFGNQLVSLTLGCGVTSLVNGLFAVNKLTDVVIPDCITLIDPMTFFGQNPWGGVIEQGTDPAHYWYSSDQNVLQLVYDNIWYVRLHTNDPNNLNNLEDSVTSEDWYTGNLNGDADGTDSIGGHLINPASITARYVDELNISLAADDNATGQLDNGTSLTGYLIKDTSIPEIYDISSLTEEERAALDLAFAPYYRQGQDITLDAPIITGYTLQHPSSPYTTSLLNAANLVTFTYATPTTPTQPPVTPPSTTGGGTSTTMTTQRTPTTEPAAATTDSETSAISLPDELLTSVDFTTKTGTDAAPSDLKAIMTNSRFSIDDTASCRHISSTRLLPAKGFIAPGAHQTTLGGLAFVLDCQATGGNANVTFTLGDTIADLAKTRVYKLNAQGARTDITDKVTLSNQSSNGHTTISYALTDGQSLDDDGLANGSISDPIYITVSHNTDDTVKPATSSDTTGNGITLLAVGTAVVLMIVGILVTLRRRKTIK